MKMIMKRIMKMIMKMKGKNIDYTIKKNKLGTIFII